MLSVFRSRTPFVRTASRLCRFNSTSTTSAISTSTVEIPPSASTSAPTSLAVSTVTTAITPGTKAEGALRPHLNIPVNPKHGLFAFFRKKEKDGEVQYETVEGEEVMLQSGRAWETAELRRKSFRDLHTLWYVLLRERNLLATQRHELSRLGAQRFIGNELIAPQDALCRKSMARIKGVLQERRLAYNEAAKIVRDYKWDQKREESKVWEAHKREKIAEAKAQAQARKARSETIRRAMARKQQVREKRSQSQDVGAKALKGLLS